MPAGYCCGQLRAIIIVRYFTIIAYLTIITWRALSVVYRLPLWLHSCLRSYGTSSNKHGTGVYTVYKSDIIPNIDALYRYWLHTCWVIHMWHQANMNTMTVLPINQYGWKLTDEGLAVDWDSKESIQAVNEKIAGPLKGCHYKTGCKTVRCGCKKRGKSYLEGCECTDCANSTQNASASATQLDKVHVYV